MTHLSILFAFIIPLFFSPHQGNMTTTEYLAASAPEKGDIIVYYFHTARRCITCVNIEKLARNTVKEEFGDNNHVVFQSVNIEKKENQALARKHKVGGSRLVICKGEKAEDLTATAFQFIMRDPGKLQSILIATIKTMDKA
ncbi:MAG: hypothetical protein KFH87_00720 [Bacteroidetes bacterium]|nr:hypothetical protein [Bacteroidota bacterium]